MIGVVQQKAGATSSAATPEAAGLRRAGRVVAVLFSEEVTRAERAGRAQGREHHELPLGRQRVVGVGVATGRRIAFLALRDPIGPFVPRSSRSRMSTDLRGHAMAQSRRGRSR